MQVMVYTPASGDFNNERDALGQQLVHLGGWLFLIQIAEFFIILVNN